MNKSSTFVFIIGLILGLVLGFWLPEKYFLNQKNHNTSLALNELSKVDYEIKNRNNIIAAYRLGKASVISNDIIVQYGVAEGLLLLGEKKEALILLNKCEEKARDEGDPLLKSIRRKIAIASDS